MAKKYSFHFTGSQEDFLKILLSYSDGHQKYFYMDEFIIDIQEKKWRFGVAPGGHSGGYWYIPEISEEDGVLTFDGSIQYIDPYTQQTGIKKIIYKFEEAFIVVLLLPIGLIVRAVMTIKKLFSKQKRKKNLPMKKN